MVRGCVSTIAAQFLAVFVGGLNLEYQESFLVAYAEVLSYLESIRCSLNSWTFRSATMLFSLSDLRKIAPVTVLLEAHAEIHQLFSITQWGILLSN